VGDAIEFIMWIYGVEFNEACEILRDGRRVAPSRAPVHAVTSPKSKDPNWRDSTWQEEANRIVTEASIRLTDPTGLRGREYLQKRGISMDTAAAFRLGYKMQYDPGQSRHRPAIVIPWPASDAITAVKYRFLDSQDKRDRFSQKGGGQQILFGAQKFGEDRKRLILCEGEFNALSIWQVLRERQWEHIDVASFGGQGSLGGRVVDALFHHYEKALVWVDEEEVTTQLSAPNVYVVTSPVVNDVKLDANEFLQKGQLATAMDAILTRCGWVEPLLPRPDSCEAAPEVEEGKVGQ